MVSFDVQVSCPLLRVSGINLLQNTTKKKAVAEGILAGGVMTAVVGGSYSCPECVWSLLWSGDDGAFPRLGGPIPSVGPPCTDTYSFRNVGLKLRVGVSGCTNKAM